VRLRAEELAALDALGGSDILIAPNRSEIIRLLILREFRRRTTGRSVVTNTEVASDHREGRPRREQKSPH